MTQPGISKSLGKLESILGFALLERNKQRVRLTPKGTCCYQAWCEPLASFERGYQSARAVENTTAQLNVGVDFTLDYELVSAHLFERCKDRFPTTALNIYVESVPILEQWLEDGQIDILFVPDFRRHVVNEKRMAWRYVAYTPYQIVLPCSHPLAGRESLVMGDILEEPIATFDRGITPEIQKDIEALYAPYGQQPIVAGYYKSTHEFQNLLLSLNCIGIIVGYFSRQHSSQLVRIPLSDQSSGVIGIWRREDTATQVADFCDI